MLKKCFRCNKKKDLSQFYVHSQMVDGHLNKCKECTKRDVGKYREKNIEQIRKYDRRRVNRPRNRDRNLLRNFGITLEQYEDLLLKQGGVCAICGRKSSRRLAVDHDHNTNKVRGLLCTSCNFGLGFFYDNTEFLEKAMKYLMIKT